MSSAEVSGAAGKHMPGGGAEAFVQVASKSSFLSTNAMFKGGEKNAAKALLLQKANELISQRNSDKFNNKSRALEMLSVAMLTGGTFDKVITMIEGLIKKLEEEASAELEHKQWCDKELK
jgi:hypothetical protein